MLVRGVYTCSDVGVSSIWALEMCILPSSSDNREINYVDNLIDEPVFII